MDVESRTPTGYLVIVWSPAVIEVQLVGQVSDAVRGSDPRPHRGQAPVLLLSHPEATSPETHVLRPISITTPTSSTCHAQERLSGGGLSRSPGQSHFTGGDTEHRKGETGHLEFRGGEGVFTRREGRPAPTFSPPAAVSWLPARGDFYRGGGGLSELTRRG